MIPTVFQVLPPDVDMEQATAALVALLDRPIVIETNCADLWLLLAHVQLALRHPRHVGPVAEIARRGARMLYERITPDGVLRKVWEYGFREDGS